MPTAFVLLLLLGQAISDPCYDPEGRPRFCLPPVTQLVGRAAGPCRQTCTLPAASPGPSCNGSLTLDLDGPFLLTSVTLRFCTPGPPALVLSAAWAVGGPWRPLWRRPAWPGALGGPEKVTFRSPPGPKARMVASHLRVEFGGQAGLVTTGVRGRCQCHGHAARCADQARPPRCRCRHHTTGPGCESCRPSHRDWPWRPATPQHPHECLLLHAQVKDSEQLAASSSSSSSVAPEWRRLPVHVLAVYKQRPWPVRRGGQEAWVPGADLACGCLRLRPGADYLLLGSAAAHTQPARGLVLDRRGLALPWRPHWALPLRRLQRKERGGACRGLLPPTQPGPSA